MGLKQAANSKTARNVLGLDNPKKQDSVTVTISAIMNTAGYISEALSKHQSFVIVEGFPYDVSRYSFPDRVSELIEASTIYFGVDDLHGKPVFTASWYDSKEKVLTPSEVDKFFSDFNASQMRPEEQLAMKDVDPSKHIVVQDLKAFVGERGLVSFNQSGTVSEELVQILEVPNPYPGSGRVVGEYPVEELACYLIKKGTL